MATEREEQMEALIRQYRERLEPTWPAGPLDINQIEELAGRVGQEVPGWTCGAIRAPLRR